MNFLWWGGGAFGASRLMWRLAKVKRRGFLRTGCIISMNNQVHPRLWSIKYVSTGNKDRVPFTREPSLYYSTRNKTIPTYMQAWRRDLFYFFSILTDALCWWNPQLITCTDVSNNYSNTDVHADYFSLIYSDSQKNSAGILSRRSKFFIVCFLLTFNRTKGDTLDNVLRKE